MQCKLRENAWDNIRKFLFEKFRVPYSENNRTKRNIKEADFIKSNQEISQQSFTVPNI